MKLCKEEKSALALPRAVASMLAAAWIGCLALPAGASDDSSPPGQATNNASPPYEVRVGYLIPSNRSPQPNGIANLQAGVSSVRSWYAEQMDRFGFGPKTFNIETEADGVTPRVHVLNLPQTDDFYRPDLWGRGLQAASDGGLGIWAKGEVWILVNEAHVQSPDGSITGGFAGGVGIRANYTGTALMGSDFIPRVHPVNLTDTRPYDGLIIPEIGPHPLVENVSYPWFMRTTISSISSTAEGALAHELGHALGLPHDVRNDENFHGNLMFNGLRGFRGSLRPDLFPEDDMRLEYASALAMNDSRLFNDPGTNYTDDTAPSIQVLTTGAVDPVDGHLRVEFSTSDNPSVAEISLSEGLV